MPYDWSTRWAGVFERHADFCPFSDGQMCTCGPLGYIAGIQDPDTGARVTSPMLDTLEEGRAWRREQEWAVGPHHASGNGNGSGSGHRNGNGNGRRTRPMSAMPDEIDTEVLVAQVGRQARRNASGPTDDPPRRPAPRAVHAPPSRRSEPLDPGPDHDDMPVSALIERFLSAAEDGEARGREGRPFSDDELAELEWALSGYVGSHFGDLGAGAVRGRHVFKLIDELEDAGMPRSRLRAVVDALRELFDYAADLNLIRVNPATYVSAPAEERPARRRLAETIETRAARPRGERGERSEPSAFGDSMISERVIWMCVKIVTLIFICIALVLVAESV
jgi:hypothetical protein